MESAKKAVEWLKEQLDKTQGNMQKSQAELFKNLQTGHLRAGGRGLAVTASITKLNEDLIEVQGRRIALEAAISRSADAAGGAQPGDGAPGGGRRPGPDLSTQLATLNPPRPLPLKEKYKQAHPEVQKLQAQITEMQKARAERARQIVGGLESELASCASRRATSATSSRADGPGRARQRKGAEVDAMRRRSESSKSLYDILLQKLNETGIASSMRPTT